jgi:hypothetical protein
MEYLYFFDHFGWGFFLGALYILALQGWDKAR